MDKKLSVIIPVYNGEKFLDKCLSSLINQKYKNIEILCINDGSSDQSAEIISKFVSVDDRVVVIEQDNSGVSAARNRGLNAASGYYITFCDQDDYVDENIYIEMISEMEQKQSDMAICGIEVIDIADGKKSFSRNLDEIKNKFDLFNEGMLIACVWNKIFKKSVIEKFNLSFLTGFQIAEDLEFAFKYLVCCSDRIVCINKPYYKYIQHGTNAICDPQKRISVYYCIKSMFDFVKLNVKDKVQRQTYNDILNKLFRIHAVDCAFCELPRNNKFKIAKQINEIVSAIDLDIKTRRYYEKAFLNFSKSLRFKIYFLSQFLLYRFYRFYGILGDKR